MMLSWTDRQTDSHTHRHTNRQTNRHSHYSSVGTELTYMMYWWGTRSWKFAVKALPPLGGSE